MEASAESKSRHQFFPVFLSIAALGMSLLFYNVIGSGAGPVNEAAQVLGAATQRTSYAGTVKVMSGFEVRTYSDVTYESGVTAFDFLLAARDQTGFDFGAERYDFGWYVHTVNGRRALNDEYWKFVVNGKDATVGLEEYTMKDGDTIELVLEKF